jgi:hypothetical protein
MAVYNEKDTKDKIYFRVPNADLKHFKSFGW